ncbi:hypothetical protein [Sinomonas mesophila]|uniref:hypothetical protein n=1 Tax=Sinomonas mesophila TaxID=1531955 RepID=UPI0011159A01|nr:hypothetical protein [Sinomonas mesophila]
MSALPSHWNRTRQAVDGARPPSRPAGPSLAHAEGLVGAGRRLGLRLQITQTGTPVPLGAAREEAAFRVILYGLANAAAHADAAAPVVLELHWSRGGLELRLTDTPGETALSQLLSAGADIAALEQHAARAGGSLRAGMCPDGFSVMARFPAPAPRSPAPRTRRGTAWWHGRLRAAG